MSRGPPWWRRDRQPRLRVGMFARLLAALLLVALLPLLAFWQFERQRMISSGQAEARERLQLFADRVMQQVDDWSGLNLSVMRAAASQPDMRSMQPQAQRRVISALLPELPWTYLIHTANLRGLNVARSDDAPPVSYRDRTYYVQILAGRRYAVEIQIGRTSRQPALLMAVPISDNGTLRGMLISASTLEQVTDAVTSARLGSTGFAFLMTPEGSLIAHAGEPLQREIKDYSQHPAFRAARAGDGFYHYAVGGIERVAQIRHTQFGWIAVVQQDAAENLAPVMQANRYAWLLLVLTVPLVSLFSALVARGFAKPIEQATRAAAAISHGQLDIDLATTRSDQIGDLMRAMQEMRHALATSMDQIRLHRNLLHATLEHLPEGISVVNEQLRIIAWNRRYQEIFAYPPELQQTGRPIEDLMRYNAERGQMGTGPAEAEIERRMQQLRGGAPYSSERTLPDGTVLEIRGNAVPGVGYVTSFSDITVHKHTERALRTLTESLERHVEERTRDLRAAKAEAEQANRSKTSLVAAAVHDLMQPVAAARMFAGALRLRAREPADNELLRGIESALDAEDEILGSLLDIARLESGTFEVSEADFPLAPLLQTLARECRILARARGVELRVVATRAWVRSDEALLRRILQNFLSNALRYTARGRILLGCRRAGDAVRIEVWDTGPGIAPENWQRIFREFERLDDARAGQREPLSAGGGGAGLGLAIVDRIGKRLGHRVALRSWLGRGSVFWVEMPRATPTPQREAVTPVPAADTVAELLGCTVWCLDDDARVLEGARVLLQGWGCQVTVAASGAQAVEQARGSTVPDVLLLDYRLGAEQGPDVIPELQRLWGAAVPVVVISAERDQALRAAILARGWDYLAKPVRPAQLRALLSHLIRRHRAATQQSAGT